MSPDFDGLVETSTSLGEALHRRRHAHAAQPHALVERLRDARRDRGARRRRAPRRRRARGEAQLRRLAAEPRLAGARRAASASTSGSFGEPPIVTAVHAGLETAVIGDKVARPRHDLVRPADRVPALARRARERPDRRALLDAARRRSSTSCRSRTEAPDERLLAHRRPARRRPGRRRSSRRGDGRDNTGETVRAGEWADDVCGTVGAWEGQLEVDPRGARRAATARRSSDGGSGDSVEGTVTSATPSTARSGDRRTRSRRASTRAGIPDAPQATRPRRSLARLGGADRGDLRAADAGSRRAAEQQHRDRRSRRSARRSPRCDARRAGRAAFERGRARPGARPRRSTTATAAAS